MREAARALKEKALSAANASESAVESAKAKAKAAVERADRLGSEENIAAANAARTSALDTLLAEAEEAKKVLDFAKSATKKLKREFSKAMAKLIQLVQSPLK